ncbi:MAG: ABC transporter ATP-binding protein [Bacilli bacterium]|jgi:ABC-2 type transport system ATP-binding protein|nr:ABC transporter ATP-binding protein [Bacilli bacterium]MCH4210368.1 ABC transporter ATP-binding protein [Bacilli bacterium]MCH4228840.1 ABC transporter ATP-binding protein [Bacilli bacterium]MCH4278413.1 ABC transporter ATP-binding protein [Bacilli bacterium]MCI2054742.1 ABC transporter ATP-binding protein [Bacilli bacterium]
MIEIKNVSKSYGKEMVISECSATVKDSSIAGLIGVNGSGKSTLLRLIAGVLRPNSGEILYNGEPIYENPEAKKNIFFLPDEPFYGNSATTKSLVSIYSCFYPAFTSEEFQKYLLYFGITSTKTLSSFSKGMQRKVYLSAAFASHAKVLLLDEAFDGLDPLSRDLFKKCLIEFIGAEPSRSVIIASHSLRELEDICDSFCLVDGGKIDENIYASKKGKEYHKIRLAFKESLPISLFKEVNIVYSSVDGRFITLICEGDEKTLRSFFEKFSPLAIDVSPLSLEETFIYKTEAKQ